MDKKYAGLFWCGLLLFAMIMLILPFGVFAMPAFDGTFGLKQSSGYSFSARQFGDEWHNWIETTDGYGIYQHAQTGDWQYYRLEEVSDSNDTETKRNLPPAAGRKAGAVVGEVDPALLGIPRGLHPSRVRQPGRHQTAFLAEYRLARTTAKSGYMHLLVIGVDYATTTAKYTDAEIQPQLFGASNSIADYYDRTSYSAVKILPASESYGTSNDGFIGWLRLSGSHPNTGSSTNTKNQQIAKDAIIAANPYINYADYDTNANGVIEPTELSIIIIVAGNEASYWNKTPSVWAHQWNMNAVGFPVVDGKTIKLYAQFGETHYNPDDNYHMATFGVMAHELGHLLFSLPDLYDTDKSNGDSEGVGYFDLMGSGGWGAASGANAGSSPTQLSAWSKEYLSWGNVTTISSDQNLSIPKTDSNSNSIFRINTKDSNQYFLIENRQFTGYDKGFQQKTGESGHGGLAIYHIDTLKTNTWPNYNMVNADVDNKGVDVEEANEGSYGSSMLDNKIARVHTNMFFFKGNNDRFTDTTTPGSRLKDDTSTDIHINNISAYGDTMTASIFLDPVVAVELVAFTVEADKRGKVFLSWETATETKNAGFNLYRSRHRDGAYKKINDSLILAKGDAVSGADYSYLDAIPARGTYYYKLEDVDYNGLSIMHGPEKVRVRTMGSVKNRSDAL